MKNNDGKRNLVRKKTHQIKVNRKLSNNNIQNLNQAFVSQNYQQKQNKLISEDNKNIKIQEFFFPGSYANKNVCTEYDSSPKFLIYPINSFKSNKILPNDYKTIYSNTNGNINKEKNLNLNNKNKLLFKNYTNRELGKAPKLANFKNNKAFNPHKSSTNSKNFQHPGNLYAPRSGTQYPINLSNIISKNKFQSFNNNKKNNNNSLSKINTNDIYNINLNSQKLPSKNQKMKKYNIISPITSYNSHNNKKAIKQNKSNLTYKRKDRSIISPENINTNYIRKLKTSNSNNYYKSENDNVANYSSCYNFYQKTNNNIPTKNNPGMLNTINNFGYLNINNSIEPNPNKRLPLFGQISNEDLYQNENEYIKIVDSY